MSDEMRLEEGATEPPGEELRSSYGNLFIPQLTPTKNANIGERCELTCGLFYLCYTLKHVNPWKPGVYRE